MKIHDRENSFSEIAGLKRLGVLVLNLSMPCGRLLRLCAWLAGLALAGSALAGEGTRRFEVPAGDAAETLKLAAQQGGLEIVYFAETVRGVRTPALRGRFAPREALERLVAGTGLALGADDPAGTLTVYRREPSVAASTPPHSPPPSPSNSPPLGANLRGHV